MYIIPRCTSYITGHSFALLQLFLCYSVIRSQTLFIKNNLTIMFQRKYCCLVFLFLQDEWSSPTGNRSTWRLTRPFLSPVESPRVCPTPLPPSSTLLRWASPALIIRRWVCFWKEFFHSKCNIFSFFFSFLFFCQSGLQTSERLGWLKTFYWMVLFRLEFSKCYF